jgi:hypothetical protein
MRVFLYGMQSSGASLVTFFLGQAPRTVAVVDLWNSILTPPLETVDADSVVAKAVVTTTYDAEDHVRSFRPDRKILVLRHPVQNYVSLSRRPYANENGSIDEKFEKLEAVFRQPGLFDLTLLYEDFVQRPEYTVRALQELGVRAERDFYRFPRDR